MNNRQCIGYGEFEGKCHYVTVDNPHWCPRCDKLRKDNITKQLKAIAAEMGIVLEEEVKSKEGEGEKDA